MSQNQFGPSDEISPEPTFEYRSLRERMFGNSNGLGFVAAIVCVVIALGAALIIGLPLTIQHQNAQTQTCTVEDKDRTGRGKGSSDMRVYTEDCGVLSVADLTLAGEFSSADLYGSIDVGETYIFETTGYRIEILTMFPRIRSIAQVDAGAVPQEETSPDAAEGSAVGVTVTSAEELQSLPLGTLVRAEEQGVTFERVQNGFVIVGQDSVKSVDYVASFAPLSVTYLS